MRTTVLAAMLVTIPLGCATRDAPYQFRGDLVGGIRAEPPPEASARARPLRRELSEARTQQSNPARGAERAEREPGAGAESDLEEPSSLGAGLRSLVGARDKKSSHVDFAFRALSRLGIDADRALRRAQSGRALLRVARQRNAVATPGSALLGDLVVFDNVVGGVRASLLGVVIASRHDGTVEFVYLARGVVRRGYVNATHPKKKRDKSGRVLNTFVRHNDGRNPRGTRYLAGQLLSSVVKLDRLLR